MALKFMESRKSTTLLFLSMIKHSIRLFSNTEDNRHCVQACLQMVFVHFKLPVPSIEELDIMTGHVDGGYTRDTNVIMFLMSTGFNVVHIEPLDYVRFADQGRVYLREIFSKERYEDQDKNGDIDADQRSASELLAFRPRLVVRKPLVRDIISALQSDSIPIVSTGSHVIVITGYDGDYIFVNDPGIPASSYKVSREEFAKKIYSVMIVKK